MANTGNTQQQIDYGAAANDGTGDPLRTAFIKTDDNFDNIWSAGPVGSNITIINNTVQANDTNGNLILSPNGIGVVQTNSKLLPRLNNTYDLGSTALKYRAGYFGTGGLTVDGNVSITGNLTAGNISYTSNVFVGDLQGSVYADDSTIMVDAIDNELFASRATISGNVSATYFIGNGSQLTGLAATYGNANVVANLAALGSNPVSTTGNVTASYFFGNGSQLTGLPVQYGNANVVTLLAGFGSNTVSTTGNISGGFILGNLAFANGLPATYSNANAVAYGQSGWAGNIIPSGNAVYSLGNATNQWNDLYVSNATIFMNNVPVSLSAGNVLTVNGNAVLQNDSNSTITTTGNISANYFFGNGSQLTGINVSTSSISNGTSNVAIATANGNVTVAVAGARTWTFDTTGNVTIPGNIVGTATIDIDNRATGNGADIQLYSADDILLQARDRSAGSTSEGGDINIFAGDSAEDSDTSGGDIVIEAGGGGASNIDFGGSGGFVRVEAGQGGNAIGANFSARSGGDLTLRAGDAGTNNGNIDLGNSGGDVIINAGDSTGNGDPGGTIYLTSGAADASALAGDVVIQAGGTWTFDGYGNLSAPGNINATGNVSGNYFIGNGSQLTGLAATYGNANVATFLAAFGSNTISTSGNITGNYFIGNGSLLTSLTGANVTGTVANATSATTAGTVTSNAQANITSVGTLTSLSSSGNITAGNILTGGLISATGNVTGNYFIGNGSQLTGISSANTGNVTFNNQAVVGTGDQEGSSGLYLAPGTQSVGNLQYIRVRGGDVATHIHLDTGNNAYFDQYFGSDIKYVKLEAAGNVQIGSNDDTGNSASWTFGVDGNLTVPGDLVIAGNTNVFGTNASLIQTTDDLPLLSLSSGGNGSVSSLWVEDIGNIGTSNIAAVYVNPVPGSGNVRIAVGANGNAGPNLWDFDTTGRLTLPGGSQIRPLGANLDIIAGTGSYVNLITSDESSSVGVDNTGGYITTAGGTWDFGTTGNLTAPGNISAVGNVTAANFFGNGNTLSNVATTFESAWTVPTGNSTQNFTVTANNTYLMWVDCNIPNGILAWNATATVTNTNVPVVGYQYAWVYDGGGTPIDFTSIPNQFIGTANTIVRNSTAPSATTNRFDFGINNTSGNAVTVRYGWAQIS